MQDLIDRQAAIDAFDVLCQEHRYRIPGKRETYSQYNEAWQDALDRAESIIGNLPSAQSEQRWIPCSERLPEEEYVLISKLPTTISGSKWSVAIAIRTADPRSRKIQWRDSGFGVIQDDKVLAWMPLPEPYQEGEQDG